MLYASTDPANSGGQTDELVEFGWKFLTVDSVPVKTLTDKDRRHLARRF